MTLYKYRNWTDDYNKDVLRKNELFLAPPSLFNDPFDCRIFANFIDLSTDELTEYAANLIKKGGLNEKEKEFIISKIANDPKEHQKSFEQITVENYDRHLGVLSLSSSWKHILMWSHYAANHTGYCIGLNKVKLSESYKFGAEGFVDYPDNSNHPNIHPTKDGNVESYKKAVYNKSIEWKYENEYRFTKIKQQEGFTESDRILKFQNSCIDEVIIGINANREAQDEIIAICRDRKLSVYKAERTPFKFQIRKTLIKK